MQTENSTKLQKSTAQNYAEWAGVIALVLLAIAINGGANFYGGYILATEMGMPPAAGYAVGSALAIVILFLLGAYLSGKRGLPVIYLHLFSGCLLMFDVVHLAGMSVNAVTAATGNISQIEREIADIDFQIQTATKELDGLASTVTGNNVQSLTAQINTLKNTTVSGGALWSVSAGCTVGGYRTKCGQIATLQGELDAEISVVSGAEVTKKRGEIAKLRGMKTEKEGMKQGMSEKSDSAGFIAKMKPENMGNTTFLLTLSAPFAISFELFSVLAFGMLQNKLTPKNPENRGMKGHELGHGFRAWIGAWIEMRLETQKRAALVHAAAKAKEEVVRNEELNQKQAELDRQKTELSGDVLGYLKMLTPKEVGALMDKKGCEAMDSKEAKARLRDVVIACLSLYEPAARIAQSGANAMFERVGDKQKHFRLRVIPALITLGLAENNGGAVSWVSADNAWSAVGKPVITRTAPVPVAQAPTQPRATKPVLTAIKGGLA